MIKTIVLMILFRLTMGSIAGCDCNWMGDFFQASKEMDFVVRAKIVERIVDENGLYRKMKVEIEEVFKGTENRKIIMIWGDGGADCRPYISYFDVGERYYLARSYIDGDYEQINCGELYLKVDDGKVWGDPSVGKELSQISGMSETLFVKKLRAGF
ncbi:MAG: hypothetical protein AAFX87_17725 [Bacteroidota bacterium]